MIRVHSAADYPIENEELSHRLDMESHCVLIVGYNDDKEEFDIVAPWNPNWGGQHGGVGKLPYEALHEATIASTVGASTLGTPIIIGLSGFNTAYVIQGALLVALAAIIADRLFERLVQALSQQQLRDIYAGKITNWKDVGGKDQEIVAFQRGEDSGSQTLFKKLLIQGGELMTPPSELARNL